VSSVNPRYPAFVTEDRALLMAVPLRHLESATPELATLPAGGPGDLDAAAEGLTVVLMATEAGDAEVPAATWRATFVRRVAHEPGTPWPDGVPPTWADEHDVRAPTEDSSPPPAVPRPDDEDDDDWDDDDDEEEELVQAFLEVSALEPLPRDEWVFANELVGKQARRGRSYLPRVPTLVSLPD
jgi:hypothetical protein